MYVVLEYQESDIRDIQVISELIEYGDKDSLGKKTLKVCWETVSGLQSY